MDKSDLGPPPSYEEAVISSTSTNQLTAANVTAPPSYQLTTAKPTSTTPYPTQQSPVQSIQSQPYPSASHSAIYTIPVATYHPHPQPTCIHASTQSSPPIRTSNAPRTSLNYYNGICGNATPHERRKRMVVYVSICVFAVFMVVTLRFLAF